MIMFNGQTSHKQIIGGNVIWKAGILTPSPGPDYTEPFYIENLSSNNTASLLLKREDEDAYTISVEYSTDRTSWSTLGNTSTDGLQLSIAPNQKVYLRSTTPGWGRAGLDETQSYIVAHYNTINMESGNCTYRVGGNIMSLIYGSGFTGQETTFPVSQEQYDYYRLASLFNGDTYLVDASNLLLPATTLTSSCYHSMFRDCTSLVSVPSILPATTLTSSCYYGMFWGCSSLTTAPELPATTLASACYMGMFYDCTSLTVAPVLPAAVVPRQGYYMMFHGCSSLNYIECLATDLSAGNNTTDWTNGVAANGMFVKSPDMYSWETDSNNGIPTGWVAIDDEPFYVKNAGYDDETLKIPRLGSSELTITVEYSTDKTNWATLGTAGPGSSIPEYTLHPGDKVYLRAKTNTWAVPGPNNTVNYCHIYGMSEVGGNIMSLLYGDDYTGRERSFPDNTSYTFYGLLSNNMSTKYLQDASKLILPAMTLNERCYRDMFHNCSTLVHAPFILPAPTLAASCYSYMFEGCTGIDVAPVLPARTLVSGCYYAMFRNDMTLNKIVCLATNPDLLSTSSALYEWVDGVAASGTFVKLNDVSTWPTGVSGIPNDWTVQDVA